MTPVDIGILGVIALFVLMFLGMNIGLAMGLVAIAGLAALTSLDAALLRLGSASLGITLSYSMAVLPLFMLMGEFAFLSGLASDAYYGAHKWLGHLPGGLGMATIVGCAGFSAVCGSSIATTTTMGSVALPEMRRYKYAPALSIGSIAAGGTMGILIPPSAAFILYGIITEESIGRLYMAGIFPGLLLTFLFMMTIYVLAKRNPALGPPGPKTSLRERLGAFKDAWGVVVLFVVVMGGLYTGVFTPTEAAAVGALCAFLIALVKRKVTKQNLIDSFMNMVLTTGMVFLILIGAIIYGYFMAASRLTTVMADFVIGLPLPPIAILIAILLLFLILGCVMDTFAMLMIVVPVLVPVIVQLGYNSIWFAVVTVIMMELGMITPPVGMNVFIMHGVAKDVSMYTIFKGVMPYAVAMAVCVALLVAFPQIALFLPGRMH
jgi:tripartite ATP-independent transporter DctM subunit